MTTVCINNDDRVQATKVKILLMELISDIELETVSRHTIALQARVLKLDVRITEALLKLLAVDIISWGILEEI